MHDDFRLYRLPLLARSLSPCLSMCVCLSVPDFPSALGLFVLVLLRLVSHPSDHSLCLFQYNLCSFGLTVSLPVSAHNVGVCLCMSPHICVGLCPSLCPSACLFILIRSCILFFSISHCLSLHRCCLFPVSFVVIVFSLPCPWIQLPAFHSDRLCFLAFMFNVSSLHKSTLTLLT